MDLFSPEFYVALLSVIIIDLVMAGDNAIVIGMSARNLPKHQQKKAIFWGTLGAIVIRTVFTLAFVQLLQLPGLLLVGGLLLIWISYKLLVEEKKHDVKEGKSLWSAIRTIIIADAVMGLDNVLAVAGAAHSNVWVVVFGLLISIPIMIGGSTIILRLIERFPVIIYIGAGILAWTAGKMIVGEKFLKGFFEDRPLIKWGLEIALIIAVLVAGRLKKRKQETQPAA
jgi:YjbE family integral membrane protein